MKKTPGASVSNEWKAIARRDWSRVRRNLRDQDIEAAAFFLQQSLEKYLKAFLLMHKWKLRKIHDLDALLDEAVKHHAGLERFRDLCERLSGYYFAERYPPLGALDITSEDIRKDITEAKKFVKMLFPKEKIGR
jgi:HEPN domain-containing protein